MCRALCKKEGKAGWRARVFLKLTWRFQPEGTKLKGPRPISSPSRRAAHALALFTFPSRRTGLLVVFLSKRPAFRRWIIELAYSSRPHLVL